MRRRRRKRGVWRKGHDLEAQPVQEGQLGKEDEQECKEVEREEPGVVPRVVCRDEEADGCAAREEGVSRDREKVCSPRSAAYSQSDWNTRQPLFGRRVLRALVNLLPQRQLVVGPRIALKGRASDVVEHEVRNLGKEEGRGKRQ